MRLSSENIEKKRANTSVLIRKADAFAAVIEAAAMEESETDVLRRIDRIPPVAEANVAFLCDGRKCDSCSAECVHTLDVSHAKNFSKRDGAFFENEEPQKDQPVKGRGVFIPDVTVDMIRNAPLEGIEELLNNGEMYNVPKPTETYRSQPAGDYISRADVLEIISEAQDGSGSTYNVLQPIFVKVNALPSADADIEQSEYIIKLCEYQKEIAEMQGMVKLLKERAAELERNKCVCPSAEAVDVAHDIPEYCRWSQTYTNMVQGAMSKASAEAVQGEWRKTKLKDDMWICSACGSPLMTDDISETHFCPNCGARMTPYKGGDSE